MAQTKVKSELIEGGLGTDWQSTIQTSNFAAEAGKGYFVNTTSGGVTLTLPSSPSFGDEISVVDYTGTFSTYNLTINANGNKIRGGQTNKVLNANNKAVKLVFTDSTEGWVIASSASHDDLGAPTYSIEALIVAGGGGAAQGAGNGGGGAGGLLTGTIANQSSGIQYTITVGAGGAIANSGYHTAGNDGNNSIIAIAGGSTHTSNGGGRGGAGTNTPVANPGGSGGGGGGAVINGTNTNGGASNQTNSAPLTGHGNAGGNGTGYNDYIGAGGGGAGASGGVPSGSYPNILGGDGGVGLTSTLISESLKSLSIAVFCEFLILTLTVTVLESVALFVVFVVKDKTPVPPVSIVNPGRCVKNSLAAERSLCFIDKVPTVSASIIGVFFSIFSLPTVLPYC